MPELPEVETVAQGLRASLVGHTVVGVDVRWARSVVSSNPTAFAGRLTGQAVIGVGRRGKWVVIALSGGDTLLVHLRMTGRLVLGPGEPLDDRHVRVLFSLDDGRTLYFSDQRKFGRLHLVDDPSGMLDELGPEPLADSFTVAHLGEMLAQRRGRIKPLLLNQRFLAGLGNIYTDEALWRAGVHPLRRADTLTPAEVRRLHRAIRAVLRAAIASGGTTLPDAAYQQADGRAGEFAHHLAVYGRAGQPCPRCGVTIKRIKVSHRGTHFCPRCQSLPGERGSGGFSD
ncbi:MAG: formamidopyrimidine-DNA glycosylase [Chloroflexi bacterium]|nr:MAG: formamidopyrimidine-DNA glycosylase [Chloroflexota bacterium]